MCFATLHVRVIYTSTSNFLVTNEVISKSNCRLIGIYRLVSNKVISTSNFLVTNNVISTSNYRLTGIYSLVTWPSEELPFECQKLAKILKFFKQNCQKLSFFSKKWIWQLKKRIFRKKTSKFLAFLFLHSNDNFPGVVSY